MIYSSLMSKGGSRRDQILDAAQKDLKRRRRERAGILASGLLAAGLLYLSIHVSQVAERSTLIQPFILYFFNFAVWALFLVLILVLVFLIVRNVVKFVFERRRGVMGANLRMKLIMAFMVLTLGPATVLFLLSTFILNTSIQRLYEPHVLNVVETSKEVIEAASQISEATKKVMEDKYDADGEDAIHFAEEVARAILERGWINVINGEKEKAQPDGDGFLLPGPEPGATVVDTAIPTELEQLSLFIDYKRREYNLDTVAVYNRSGSLVVRSSSEDVALPPITDADIDKALSGEQGYNPPVSVGEGAVLYAFFPVPRRGGSGSTEIAGAVVAGRYVSWIPAWKWHESKEAEEAKAVIEDYQTLRRLELPIKFSYFILLVFVTLIVIFLAIWFGFYVSKGITEPIALLAEGTEMVASGNLDYRIDLAAEGDDEISTLVRSFNKMTADLSSSQAKLDTANRDLRETNLEVDKRRSYMETVLAHAAAGVVSVDTDNIISTINPAALSMLGETSESRVMGRPLSSVLKHEEMAVFEFLADELESTGKDVVDRQINLVRENRSIVVLITISRLIDDQGKSLGTVIVLEDMTELIRAHRAMAWREVARRIAHEIKNPLTPIQLAAQRMKRRYAGILSGEDAEVLAESTDTIIRQVEALKHLVNEFSLFARLPSANPESSDLNLIIREVMPLYREAHPGISLNFEEATKLPTLELDREQIKRVFINLLDNAAASIEGEGQIVIETSYDGPHQVVRIEVRDTGCGILPHVKDRLFEPYYSTKSQGTGLGLTIVQRIISDHYGYIRVVGNQPRGTKVIIELPVVRVDTPVEPPDRDPNNLT